MSPEETGGRDDIEELYRTETVLKRELRR